jgi:AIPR protein
VPFSARPLEWGQASKSLLSALIGEDGSKMAQQKAQFRDLVKQFCIDNYGCDISSLSDIQRSDVLTLTYILKIFNQRNPGLFPDDIEELRLNIVDGTGDRGADFIFKSDTQIYIFQSKYRKPEASEIESEFDYFRAVLKRLCPDTGAKHKKNQKVLDLIADIDWETDSFALYYISLAKPHAHIQATSEADLDNVPNTVLRNIDERGSIEYLSEVDLNEQYREVLRSGAGAVTAIDILLSRITKDDERRLIEINLGGDRRCFIAALSAGQIHQLYQKHKGSLFNLNIRNYIGDTRTNKDIIATAIAEPDNFFFYNNGISAVARKVVPQHSDGKTTLQCTDFSIINGAQTFRSISKAHAKNATATAKLLVPLRITEFDFAKARSDSFLEKITKFNNTQNTIKISDFRSNDPVQTSISNYMSNVMASGGRKFFYRNKRSQIVDRSKIFVGLDEFCRTIHAVLFGPADIFGGLSYLYDTSPKGGYTKLFGDPNEPLAEATFNAYFAIWLICARAREVLKQKAAEREDAIETTDDADRAYVNLQKNALERKYHVFFVLGEVLREVCKIQQRDFTQFLNGYSRPKWRDDKKKQDLIDLILEVACDALGQTYQVASKSGDFVHRNFFRDEAFPNLLRESLATRRSQIKSISL